MTEKKQDPRVPELARALKRVHRNAKAYAKPWERMAEYVLSIAEHVVLHAPEDEEPAPAEDGA